MIEWIINKLRNFDEADPPSFHRIVETDDRMLVSVFPAHCQGSPTGVGNNDEILLELETELLITELSWS